MERETERGKEAGGRERRGREREEGGRERWRERERLKTLILKL